MGIIENDNFGLMEKAKKMINEEWFWGYISALAETYYFVPSYLLSRSINVLFPLIIVCYLAITDSWSQIDLFQYVMLGIYVFLFLIWSIFAWLALKRSFWIFHLSLGGGFRVNKLNKSQYNGSILMMQCLYDEILSVPKRKKVVIDMLGAHIGSVVMSFLSNSIEIKSIQQLRALRLARKNKMKQK